MPMPMPMPMHFSNFLSFKNGQYNVSWMFNSSMDTLHFMVEVMATGWVGFGFSTQMPPTSPSMTGYDVAVGGVSSGGVGELKVKYLATLYINRHFQVKFESIGDRLCAVRFQFRFF